MKNSFGSREKSAEKGLPMVPQVHHQHPMSPAMHVPPHLRKRIEFNEKEWEMLISAMCHAFPDEATLEAAVQVFQDRAPQEIQILIFQLGWMISKVASGLDNEIDEAQPMDQEESVFEETEHPLKYSIMGPTAQALYADRYSDKAEDFIKAMEIVPDEIAVVSRMAACLDKLLSMKKGG